MKYLLDTNIVSEPTRPTPNQNVIAKWTRHQDEYALCTVVITEILKGIYRLPNSRRKQLYDQHLQRLINNDPILDYDLRAAYWLAQQSARLEAIGLKPAYADGMIAAVAATNNLTLVTRNIRDFDGFNGLRVENWFEEI